jgi:hypothetical protein
MFFSCESVANYLLTLGAPIQLARFHSVIYRDPRLLRTCCCISRQIRWLEPTPLETQCFHADTSTSAEGGGPGKTERAPSIPESKGANLERGKSQSVRWFHMGMAQVRRCPVGLNFLLAGLLHLFPAPAPQPY